MSKVIEKFKSCKNILNLYIELSKNRNILRLVHFGKIYETFMSGCTYAFLLKFQASFFQRNVGESTDLYYESEKVRLFFRCFEYSDEILEKNKLFFSQDNLFDEIIYILSKSNDEERKEKIKILTFCFPKNEIKVLAEKLVNFLKDDEILIFFKNILKFANIEHHEIFKIFETRFETIVHNEVYLQEIKKIFKAATRYGNFEQILVEIIKLFDLRNTIFISEILKLKEIHIFINKINELLVENNVELDIFDLETRDLLEFYEISKYYMC